MSAFHDTMTAIMGGVGNFLTSNTGSNLLTGAGGYLLNLDAIEDVEALGTQAQQQLTDLGQQVYEQAQFQPFTVTTGLGTTTADPTGSVSVGLTPEQQALQNQLLGQATGLFGQVGVSPTQAQADIYEQIRATQRPEEERQRLAMEERLLSQGRLGLQSAAYGGTSPELLAMETARQEAMARANLSARGQALAEQEQALNVASGLLGQSYAPQREVLNALNVSSIAPQLASRGAMAGAELLSQLGQSGVEANIGMQQLATELRQNRDQGLMNVLLGTQPTTAQIIAGADAGLSPEQLIVQGLLSRIFGGGGDSNQNSGSEATSLSPLTPTLTTTNIGDMTTEQFINTIFNT